MPFIIPETGPSKGETIRLEAGRVYRCGRAEGCEIPLHDPLGAEVHFEVGEREGRFFLRSRMDEPPVLVNDAPVREVFLRNDDKIQVGDAIFSFLVEAGRDPLIGGTVAGYAILEHIGRGGMGTVYRARQVSLNRDVAVKVLSPRLTRDEAFRERFIREARAAGAFNHPNVLQVYDVIHEGDLCFYSMEYVPGGTVEDRIREGPVPVDEALRILRDAARGLHYAEQKGIIHHDIKPQNLMITELGLVKIADMGLAGSLEEGRSGKGGVLVGTPHFMAPERILRKPLDIRSDIYSLGCTFYMILTGRTPFQGRTVKEILRKHLKASPTPVRELRPEVPDKAVRLVERMMAKDPEERFPSTEALLQEIAAAGARKGGRLLLAAVIAAVLLLAAAGAWYFAGRKPAEEDRSGMQAVRAAAEARSAEEEEAYRRQMEQLKAQVREKEALAEYLKIPEKLQDAERLARLRHVAETFAGTPTGKKAAAEAEALAAELERRQEAEEARAAALARLEAQGGEAVGRLLEEERFVEALDRAARLGRKEGLFDAPEAAALRARETKRVKEAASARCDALLAEAKAKVEAHDFDGARAVLDRLKTLFRPPKGKAAPEAAAFLDKLGRRIADAVTETAKAERAWYLALFDGDRDRFLGELHPKEIRDRVLAWRFAEAAAPFEKLASELRTGAYRALTSRLGRGPAAAARLLARFEEAVTAGSLEETRVPVPGAEKKEGEIVGLMEGGEGVKIRITQGARTGLVNVPFAQFDTPEAFAALIDGRFPMEGTDKLDLAEAVLHFAAAAAAATCDPLAERIQAYDPGKGWTAEDARAAGTPPAPDPEVAAAVKRLAGEAEALDPSLADRAAELRRRLAGEQAALQAFREGVRPFFQAGGGFAEAETRLRSLAASYTDTVFYFYVLDLMGGTVRPGGHLVEFSR